MNNLLKITTLLLFTASSAFAQDAEMADTMRSEGKIYVLLAIVLVVLFGLITYLISIDRKVSRIEKNLPGKKG